MKKRQHTEYFFLTGSQTGEPCEHLGDIGRKVALGQHRTLGPAGGATGVLKHGNVLVDIDND